MGQGNVPKDAGQQVVEVMSDSACQETYRLKLFGVQHLFFQPELLPDVTDDNDGASNSCLILLLLKDRRDLAINNDLLTCARFQDGPMQGEPFPGNHKTGLIQAKTFPGFTIADMEKFIQQLPFCLC